MRTRAGALPRALRSLTPGGIALLLLLAACRQPAARQPAGTSEPADLVLLGATVYTMDPSHSRAEAIAIRAGRIVQVGSRDAAQALVGAGTRVYELGGRAVLPGLHDMHNHLVLSATELEDVDLFAATTVAELLAPISARAVAAPREPWIRGTGWNASVFEGKLDRSQLDLAVPDRPVYMAAADGHSAWVNSAALRHAGITAETRDPADGRIERDRKGEPTGILRESAMELVSKHIPPYSPEQVDRGLAKILPEVSAHGITSIVDPGTRPWMLDGYQRSAGKNALTVRVHAALRVDPERGVRQVDELVALRARYTTPMVRPSSVKLFVDGVIESRTAYMLAPYVDGSNGTPSFTDESLRELAMALDRAGFQLHAHVIGDAAVRQVLDALDAIEAANGDRDRRPILAHVQVIDDDDLPRFGTHGIYAAFSPLWAYPDEAITKLTEPVIGPERSQWLYPIAAVRRAGGILVAGSDWSVSSMDPFDAMEVAITRQAPENGGPALTPQHRVSLQEILEAYTINGARASFVDDELGSITVGKRADLIVLDRDPFTIDAQDISEIQVQLTLLDGREVHRAAALSH